jgi:HEAT repeat protein
MARSFHHTLLTAVVALVVGGSALAQGTLLQDAAAAMRLGKPDEAKAKLREILAADPSNEEALRLYQSVSQDEWYMMITEVDADIRQAAEALLARAKAERREFSRDAAQIQSLVEAATARDAGHGAQQSAINKLLAEHGEFAVPALARKLADADDEVGQIHAVYVLTQLERFAVLPLIELLKSSDELLVQNAAAALAHIGDLRAAPAMAYLATDNRLSVSSIAKGFLQKKGVQGNGVDLLLAQAQKYLNGEVPAGGFSDVVWSLRDGRLVATDVPALIYPFELAKSCAADAVAIAPQDDRAVGMLAQANLAQVSVIEASDNPAVQGLLDVVPALKMAAEAAGTKNVIDIIDAQGQAGLAVILDAAFGKLKEGDALDELSQDALIKALDSGDKRIAYAAAAALVRTHEGKDVPACDKVVKVLAEAVTEEAIRTVHVISPDAASRNAVVAAGSVRGIAAGISETALRGMQEILLDASIDVVVLNDILPDRAPADIIGNMKRDSRMAKIKVLVAAKDIEAATGRFGESVDGVLQAPLTGEALVAEVNRVLEGVVDPDGDRAEQFAARASSALLALAAGNGNIAGAIANLERQLDRGDGVAVPAANTLGIAGSQAQLDALIGAARKAGENVQVAALGAIGRILGRMEACPKEAYDTLLAAVLGEGSIELRAAAAAALGRARLDPARRAEVQQKLRRIAGSSES